MPNLPEIDPGLQAILADGRPAFPDEPPPCEEDLAWYEAQLARNWGVPEPEIIRNPTDLMHSVAGHLESLGLEPAVCGDVLLFMFQGHCFEFTLEDMDARAEAMERQISREEMAMMAAGLPIG